MKLPLLLIGFATVALACFPSESGYSQNSDSKRPGAAESAEVDKANAQIDVVYKRLMSQLDADGQKSLLEAQRSWIKWRDNEAMLMARLGGAVGGSALREDFLTVQAKLILQRTDVLNTYLQTAADSKRHDLGLGLCRERKDFSPNRNLPIFDLQKSKREQSKRVKLAHWTTQGIVTRQKRC